MPRLEDTRWLRLATIILAATVLRLVFCVVYFGFHTGDDVEILEAGFLRALALPYQPWQIRNLLVSDLLVAPVLGLASALGLTSTRALVSVATVPFILLASLNVWLVHRLAARWSGSDSVALLAGALYAFHWLPLGYGSTVYPRTASTTFVLLGVLTVWQRWGPWWRPVIAGGCLAVAFAIRYSEVIFLPPLLVIVCLQPERLRDRLLQGAGLLSGFIVGSLVTVGLEDLLTWGQPFASLLAFARYTLIERQASSLEVDQPWYWYLWRLGKWLPLTLLPLLWRARRLRGALLVVSLVLLPLVALSVIHHKQLRYLQGIIPFVLVLASAGAWSWWSAGRRWLAGSLTAVSLLWGLGGLTFLAKKSMAAVVAAEQLRLGSDVNLCVSQSWAYGGRLYLGFEVKLTDLPYPLSGEALVERIGQCDAVALYNEDRLRDPRIDSLLQAHQLTAWSEQRWGRSRSVLVYFRGPTTP